MTVIAAIKHNGRVYMGSDSASTGEDFQATNSRPKVFKRGEWIAGSRGSPRLSQLLRYTFRWPDPMSGTDIHKFMCTKFVEELRKCFHDAGWMQVQAQRQLGGQFLVGYLGYLFTVGCEFEVNEWDSTYAAIGTGAQYALGSLCSTPQIPQPETRLRLALTAAAEFCPSVRGPFHIVST